MEQNTSRQSVGKGWEQGDRGGRVDRPGRIMKIKYCEFGPRCCADTFQREFLRICTRSELATQAVEAEVACKSLFYRDIYIFRRLLDGKG